MPQIIKTGLSLLLALPLLSFADNTPTESATHSSRQDAPMVGTLLAPSGKTIPKGHLNTEAYLYYTDGAGFYNQRWHHLPSPDHKTINPVLLMSYGLSDRIEIGGTLPYLFNRQAGASDHGIGDVGVHAAYQLRQEGASTLDPAIKLNVNLMMPTGAYRHLDPARQGVDAMGGGAYQTTLGLDFQQHWRLPNDHDLRARMAFLYAMGGKAHLLGYNAYGGDADTDGRLFVGNQFTTVVGLEYALNDHWVPALDVMYARGSGHRFQGTVGGASTTLNTDRKQVISMAPAIEYNVSRQLGVIAGLWFPVTGQNSADFISGIVAVNYFL